MTDGGKRVRQRPLATRKFEFVNRTFQGDCLVVMPRMAAGTVQTAFVDPPFNIGYEYDSYDDDRKTADYLAWCGRWIGEVHRILAEDGTFWLAIGPRSYPDLDVLARRIGFYRRATVVWHYTFGTANVRNFSLSYTNLAYYTRHRTKFPFDSDICRVPSARQVVYNDRRANPKGKLPDDVWFYRPQDLPEGLPADGDVWHCPRVAGTFGSRQDVPNHMPEQVVARCLKITTPPGGHVLDPMAGSFTTPVVCKKLGFCYTAIELSPNYSAKGEARLARAELGEPIAGPNIQEGH
jgi:DNA modification methylase